MNFVCYSVAIGVFITYILIAVKVKQLENRLEELSREVMINDCQNRLSKRDLYRTASNVNDLASEVFKIKKTVSVLSNKCVE